MAFDLLADVLDLPHVRGGAFGRIVGGRDWAITSETGNDISFCAVTMGRGCFFWEGMEAPEIVEAGDIVVLSYPPVVTWASAPDMVSRAITRYAPPDGDGVFTFGDGDDFQMIAGGFLVEADRRYPAQFKLPQAIHILANSPEAHRLAWLVDELVDEMKPMTQPGQKTALDALAQLLFTHSIRAYLATAPAAEAGWLSVFNNRRLIAALASLHGEPARNWTVRELASMAGMSRSSFSDRFREILGMPPLAYLTQWRMRLAMDMLGAGASIADTAAEVGYGTERAFSVAFRRVTGMPPGAYRRGSMKLTGSSRHRQHARNYENSGLNRSRHMLQSSS